MSLALSSVVLRDASGGVGSGAGTSSPSKDCATASLSILSLSCVFTAIERTGCLQATRDSTARSICFARPRR